MSDLKRVGRIGAEDPALLRSGLDVRAGHRAIVGELVQPGAGFGIDPSTLDPKAVSAYVTRAKEDSFVAHLLGIIPDSFFGALARGDLLQILLISILSGFAISQMGALGEKITGAIDIAAKMFFGIIRIIVRAAPVGAFGAMAFTIGAYGIGSLVNLGRADPDLLRHKPAVRAARARHHRLFRRLLDPAVHRLHQGRASDRARHLVVGNRAAAHDAEDGAARRLEIGGRPRDPDRLQLQSRRHQHLHDAVDAVSRAGDQHAAYLRPGARHPGHRHDHV